MGSGVSDPRSQGLSLWVPSALLALAAVLAVSASFMLSALVTVPVSTARPIPVPPPVPVPVPVSAALPAPVPLPLSVCIALSAGVLLTVSVPLPAPVPIPLSAPVPAAFALPRLPVLPLPSSVLEGAALPALRLDLRLIQQLLFGPGLGSVLCAFGWGPLSLHLRGWSRSPRGQVGGWARLVPPVLAVLRRVAGQFQQGSRHWLYHLRGLALEVESGRDRLTIVRKRHRPPWPTKLKGCWGPLIRKSGW